MQATYTIKTLTCETKYLETSLCVSYVAEFVYAVTLREQILIGITPLSYRQIVELIDELAEGGYQHVDEHTHLHTHRHISKQSRPPAL